MVSATNADVSKDMKRLPRCSATVAGRARLTGWLCGRGDVSAELNQLSDAHGRFTGLAYRTFVMATSWPPPAGRTNSADAERRFRSPAPKSPTSVVMGNTAQTQRDRRTCCVAPESNEKRTAGEHQSGRYGLMLPQRGAELAAWRDAWKSRHSEVSCRVAGGGCGLARSRGGK
jgi:hypothetical protein